MTKTTAASLSLYFRLSLLQLLEHFVLGSWVVTTGTYLLQTLEFSGRQVGLVYSGMAMAALVSPFMVGMIADKRVASERLLSFLHLAGGGVMWLLSTFDRFAWFYPVFLLYALLVIPTMALTTAFCFHHVSDGRKEFPRIRVWGTAGWVLAGFLISWLGAEETVTPLRISGTASIVLGLYALSLPHTPPQGKRGIKSISDFFGQEILDLLKRRDIAVLVIALGCIAIPSGFYYSFTNSFLTEIGMEGAAGKMALGQVSEIFFMLTLPFMFRFLRIRYIIFIGLCAWGGRYALFSLGDMDQRLWMLYTGILLHGVAFNFTMLATQIFLDQAVPASVRSTTQGFISFLSQGIGGLTGAYLAGEVVDWFTFPNQTHDWNQIWMVPAGIGLSVALFFLMGFRRRRQRQR
jgi:nucleoside transporter